SDQICVTGSDQICVTGSDQICYSSQAESSLMASGLQEFCDDVFSECLEIYPVQPSSTVEDPQLHNFTLQFKR
ncbi:mucolipin-3 isoform X1, partial [Tachysurus ichikawai]